MGHQHGLGLGPQQSSQCRKEHHRGIVWLVDKDWLLDIVDFFLGLDNWGVDSLGSLEDSWDSNWEMWGGWLQDSGGVSGDIVGLTVVHLLGDNWGWLVDSCDSLTLSNSGVWSWGCWGNMVDWVMDNGSGSVVFWAISWDSSWSGSSIGNWGSGNSSNWSSSHSWGSYSVIRWSTVGASQDKSKCHKRFHVASSTE